MRTRTTPTFLAVLLIAAATACDRTPVDPLDDLDLAPLAITGPNGRTPSSLTLPGLLSSAIRKVHAEQGADAARDLVRDLARAQQRLDDAALDERAALRAGVRAEQLRIVLLVHGSDVVARTKDAVRHEVEALHRRRADLAGSGIAAPELSQLLEDVPRLLADADAAASDAEALDAITQASARTDRMRDVMASAARLPALDDLFADASSGRSGRALDHALTEARSLRLEADAALRSGDRDRAHAAATAARAAQIRLVIDALGPDAVADVIGWSQDRAVEQTVSLRAAAAHRDVSRLERMNATAADMLQRADVRLRRGDSVGALDLAAHAVDLLNALESGLPES